jgi:hypothetical protein
MGVTVQVADDIRWNLNLTGEKKVQKGLNDTGDAFDDLGDQAETAGKKSDKAGDKFKDTASDAGHLRREIETTTARVKDLVAQFDRTGDTSLFKDIRGAKRDLGRATGLAKLIAEPVAEAGKSAGSALITNLAEGYKTGSAALKGGATPILVGLAIAAAPGITAAISAAVLAGVGAGGLGAGIAAAMQNTAVAEAASGLAESLKEAFTSSADGFAAPLLGAFEILGDAGRQFAAQLNLNSLASLITPLAKGLAGLGQNLVPGLNKAFEAAKPLLRILANELPNIGAAISEFFTTVSSEGDGAGLALAGVLQWVSRLIVGAGKVIATLSGIYEWSVRTAAGVTGFMEDVVGWVPLLGDAVAGSNDDIEAMIAALEKGKDASGDFAGGVDVIGESAEETAAKIQELKDGIESLFGKTMDLDQATLAYKRGFKELTEGKRTLDLNTEAGQDNEESVLRRIQQLEDLRKANANSNMGVDAANRLYEKHIEQLRRTLLNLGYNKAEVNALIDRYKAIPKNVETTIGIILKTQGSESAWAALRKSERQAEEAAGKRASGGPVAGGKTYWVGENGPELVTFGENGFVHNAADSRAMTSGGSSMGMGGGTAVQVVLSAAPGPMQQFVEYFIPHLQVAVASHGGVVQEVLGTPTR